MASIASVSTANPGSGSSITVTKPTGLAVGDLMIFHYTFNDATDTANTISGWTHEVSNQAIANGKVGVQFKIADSADAAAADFTMTFTGTVASPLAAILRVTDFITDGLLNENTATAVNSATTLSMSVTPLYTNNLLIMLLANNKALTTSGYAIATDNPTWTEQYDIQAGSITGLSCATATRTAVTATGNTTFSYGAGGDGTEDTFGILFAIETPFSVSFTTDAPGVLTLSTPEPSFVLDNTFSIDSAGTLTISSAEPAITVEQNNAWTEEGKNSATWTEESK